MFVMVEKCKEMTPNLKYYNLNISFKIVLIFIYLILNITHLKEFMLIINTFLF